MKWNQTEPNREKKDRKRRGEKKKTREWKVVNENGCARLTNLFQQSIERVVYCLLEHHRHWYHALIFPAHSSHPFNQKPVPISQSNRDRKVCGAWRTPLENNGWTPFFATSQPLPASSVFSVHLLLASAAFIKVMIINQDLLTSTHSHRILWNRWMTEWEHVNIPSVFLLSYIRSYLSSVCPHLYSRSSEKVTHTHKHTPSTSPTEWPSG